MNDVQQFVRKLTSLGYHNWEIIPVSDNTDTQNNKFMIYCNGYRFFKIVMEDDKITGITVIIDRWTLEKNLNVSETEVLNRFLAPYNLGRYTPYDF